MGKLIWPKWPIIDNNSIKFTSSGLLNGRFSIAGNEVNSISFIRVAEKKLEEFTITNYSILTSNGSAALLLALQSLNVGTGDEVILPALTWVGVATAVLRVGAKPIFIDSSNKNPYMDFMDIESQVTSNTKAIIAPHLYSTLTHIGLLKRRFPDIPIIEDSSHCSGLYERVLRTEQPASDIIIFSLQATKSLTCGEGGAVLVKNKELAENILSLRNDSRIYNNNDSEKLELTSGNYHGANFNLSDIQAAFLLDQLEKHKNSCLQRTKFFRFFQNLSESDSSIEITFSKELTDSGNFYGVPCKINCTVKEFSRYKKEIEKQLNLKLWNPYTPIPFSELYKPNTVKSYVKSEKYKKGRFNNSFEWIKNRFIIPHYVFLSNERQIEILYNTISRNTNIKFSQKTFTSYGVSVIILTKNRKEKLINAINSVIKQDYKHDVEILLIGDNCDYLNNVEHLKLSKNKNITLRKHNIILDKGIDKKLIVQRVATLRSFAIKLASQNCISFLDDDNLWEVNHLSSLMDTMNSNQCMVTYSWRKLYLSNGNPWIPTTWPWLGSDVPQKELLNIYEQLDMLDFKTNILKDKFKAVYKGRDYATIDMGAWLFKKELFDVISFKTDYSKEEVNCLVTEDDQLLLDLKKFNFLAYPSEKATLKYYLGGFSNLYNHE